MAGTAILKKQSTTTSSSNINNQSKTANLYIISHSIAASRSCCLWLQQPQVVESASINISKCNSNDRPMKDDTINNYHNSSCTLDDRIFANCNYNIKTLKEKQQLTTKKQRPLTLSLATIIIMSLSILFIQKPTMVEAKSIYEEAITIENKELNNESNLKVLLSQDETPSSSSSSSSASAETSLNLLNELLNVIESNQRHHRERKMRLRKRHIRDLIITKYLHEDNHNLEWKNPCNVDHINMQALPRRVSKQQKYMYMKKLEHDISMEYELISATANTININDIADWNKHDEIYNFLPKLNVNESITLQRMDRYMQVYVGSLGFLARLQYKFDQHKGMFVGSISDELNKLFASARFILCELETTINGSNPNSRKPRIYTRKAMNKRVNFVSKHLQANGGIVAPNTVDLKFAKYNYFQFLQNMKITLNQKLHINGKKYGINSSSEDYNGSIRVGDDDSTSLDFSSIFKSDSNLSVNESVEILLKNSKKSPHTQRH